MARKKTILDFIKMKKEKQQVAWITAYDYPLASFAEQAGIDMILVGDSLGMVVLGYKSTNPVTMEECLIHCQAVRRGAPNTWVVGDMPFMSYQVSDEEAVFNAGRFIKQAAVDSIKLEGGVRVTSRIRAIVDSGIPVMGHIGLTPQSSGQLGGFKAQGRDVKNARALIKDALAVEEAGAYALLVEAVPPEVTAFICSLLEIPVYGIGAGPADGQLLICGDMLGMFQAFTPKFVKQYANVAEIEINAIKTYVNEVKEGLFPSDEHAYHVVEPMEEFEKMFKEFKK
ncbi:MAG TPA: 3-methyl-2-oxobutanoate hydroxymethyltransferase [Bacillota bacterium]|jgi:3-methyl-2-oxobutanoate hydroxymethyltransferase|nr:3-methyl-2-oxobutanoate hydroxymethyltransferase [Bacillota bacterium]HOA35440.1 3-methyl-2-oxobutanoate hydroxymethyltransferase [Bacillota bacterium]HOJ84101.1 3-methyl-2-oxobutanoate hydroxymethyltransferase [Bacillota bacterium]HOL15909.1 3-methyl-2-oxobutanoate hydroxymethyltransferase [Bacillota bacterium]HPZ11767.1 3-methyl-2-oxobutanoate hydroxymethyltransferase [Bacillota bacterium]